jgi:hypothetical protein
VFGDVLLDEALLVDDAGLGRDDWFLGRFPGY